MEAKLQMPVNDNADKNDTLKCLRANSDKFI